MLVSDSITLMRAGRIKTFAFIVEKVGTGRVFEKFGLSANHSLDLRYNSIFHGSFSFGGVRVNIVANLTLFW